MSTANENAGNSWYVFEKSDETLKNGFNERITHRNNLVKRINELENGVLEDYLKVSMIDKNFSQFISKVEELGYTIYKLTKQN